jgi:4-amino-4-deoxy-L-arabinose transferase-like glycosyltransferase
VWRIVSAVSGFIIIQLPFIYYFWIHDALKDVYQALFTHVPVYAKLSRGLRIEAFLSGHYSILSENLVLWLFASLASLFIISRDRTRINAFIVLWAITSLVMVWIQGKFFGYHFIILMPPFSVLMGYGLFKLFKEGKNIKGFILNNLKDMSRAFMLVTLILSVVGLGISNYDYYKWHVQYALKKISKSEYYSVFN